MTALANIATGLANALEAIPGLTVYDTIPGNIIVPCVIVTEPETIEYDLAMGRGVDGYTIGVLLLVSRADEDSGRDELHTFLASSGTSSLKAALEVDRSLGGVVDSLRVRQIRHIGAHEANNISYLGAEAVVEIWAGG